MNRVVDGWLQGVARLPTPNVDDRPAGESVELVVIHNISLPPGEYGRRNVQALFTNALDPRAHPFFAAVAGARVSAHLLIERDGTVTQFAPFDRRAWHAGVSEFDGRPRCNDFSVGIELEGTDATPYTSAQYETLAQIAAELCHAYPMLAPDAVVGHSDVAPGRKSDPGIAFDWPMLRSLVRYFLEVRPA